jgi:hypothetical protein
VGQPGWDTITAEYLTHEILVVVDEGIDTVLASHIDEFLHVVEVGFVVLILSWLNTRPHHSQADAVEAYSRAVHHILL